MSRKFKATPFFSVEVNGVAYPYYSPNVQIIQETDKHTIMLLDVLYKGKGASRGNTKARTSWSYLKEKTPVRVTYGMNPGYLADQLGYVASYKVLRTAADKVYPGIISTRVQYTIVGTSMPMQSTVNRAWKHISPSSIAARLAVKNGLRAIIHPYSSVYDYRLQNSSDFHFLCELADEIGYRFFVDNTDLHFVDPNVVIQANTNNVPQFWAYNTPGVKDTLEEFMPTVGTTTSDKLVATRSMSGISPAGIFVSASQQYSLYEAFDDSPASPILSQYENFPVESYAEAKQRLEAATRRNQYWATANATVWGDYRVRPNQLVEFTGQGVAEDDKGFWLVQKAVHELFMPAPRGNVLSGQYHINMSVQRNQSYTINYSSPSQLATNTKPVEPRLVNGVWRSSNIGAQAYAN